MDLVKPCLAFALLEEQNEKIFPFQGDDGGLDALPRGQVMIAENAHGKTPRPSNTLERSTVAEMARAESTN